MIINQRNPSGSIFRFGYQIGNGAITKLVIALGNSRLRRYRIGNRAGSGLLVLFFRRYQIGNRGRILAPGVLGRRYQIGNRGLQRRMFLVSCGLGQRQPVEGVLDPDVAAGVIPAATDYESGFLQLVGCSSYMGGLEIGEAAERFPRWPAGPSVVRQCHGHLDCRCGDVQGKAQEHTISRAGADEEVVVHSEGGVGEVVEKPGLGGFCDVGLDELHTGVAFGGSWCFCYGR